MCFIGNKSNRSVIRFKLKASEDRNYIIERFDWTILYQNYLFNLISLCYIMLQMNVIKDQADIISLKWITPKWTSWKVSLGWRREQNAFWQIVSFISFYMVLILRINYGKSKRATCLTGKISTSLECNTFSTTLITTYILRSNVLTRFLLGFIWCLIPTGMLIIQWSVSG